MDYLKKTEIANCLNIARGMMENKELVIVFNSIGFTNKIDITQEDSDFFTNKEIGAIFDALIESGIKVIPYNNETCFSEDILTNKFDTSQTIVWNLSRQGSDNNQKSLVTSLSDYYQFTYLGSSVYTMNLCRHKYHFQKILDSYKLAQIKTYTVNEFINDSNLKDGKYIIKMMKGSASRGLSKEKVNLSKEKVLSFLANNEDNSLLTIQEFVPGYEIEIPLFKIKGEFKAIGIAGVNINDKDFLDDDIMPEELNSDNSYRFYDFINFTNKELGYDSHFIIELAIRIATILEIENYCRIDFRVSSNGNPYCFDISTTPYVTEHSSPNYLIDKAGFTHSDLMLLILSTLA
ncbi:hypothetical protein ACWOC1_01170 [Enterococcus quebecensis]|uniref:ATP-grasp domain-containing protein n=1 Tax=Enterococcus quebecensis TaxID=903983 RepID=A0A1E5H098_9ENTE|nr:hypothetical protein [Enterococcus quebecensis]OEG18010.1 hypothetical protein BCR23_14375 [Enterococcus quebecensis]